jgi:replicative DNA helicase
VPSAANVKDYAKIVKDKSKLRKLITVCDDINKEAYEESSPVKTIIDSAEQKIFDISNNNDTKELRHISDILQTVYQDLEMSAEMRNEKKGTKTGFSGLDDKLIEITSYVIIRETTYNLSLSESYRNLLRLIKSGHD